LICPRGIRQYSCERQIGFASHSSTLELLHYSIHYPPLIHYSSIVIWPTCAYKAPSLPFLSFFLSLLNIITHHNLVFPSGLPSLTSSTTTLPSPFPLQHHSSCLIYIIFPSSSCCTCNLLPPPLIPAPSHSTTNYAFRRYPRSPSKPHLSLLYISITTSCSSAAIYTFFHTKLIGFSLFDSINCNDV